MATPSARSASAVTGRSKPRWNARTLQLALSGVRELSIIASPPIDRLAVRTFVSPFDPVIVREALLRERAPLYEAAADLTVDTTGLSHDEVAQAIEDSLADAG